MLRSLVLALVLVSAAPEPRAQCLAPDNLQGPCCSLVSANLPAFPAITLPGVSICWDACSPNSTTCNTVALAAPVQVQCAEYTLAFQSMDCSGQPELQGQLHLDYTRSWDEFPIPGTVSQVWRFVVKADLQTTSNNFGCTIPNCLGTHNTAFYYGYLDYAFDCSTSTWESALVLFHGCDAYQHDPALSSRPGAFHPTRSFALVAPSTAANPFVPAVSIPTGGPLLLDGMRDAAGGPPPLACEASELLTGGAITNLVFGCACPLSFTPPQVSIRHMIGASQCGSQFRSINAFPTVPWIWTMSTSIGTWTTAASYPGIEAVWADEGAFLHVEGCTAAGNPEFFGEIKVGATTQGGFPAGVGPLPADRFTDLVDNYSRLLGTPITPPFFGSVNPTTHLVYVNPF